MEDIAKYVPGGLMDRIRRQFGILDKNDFLKEIKKIYIKNIYESRGGHKLIEHLFEKYGIYPYRENFDILAERTTLSEIYFYFTYFLNCRLKSYIFRFDGELNVSDNLFNDYGQPIWTAELTNDPKLWVAYDYNDDKKTIFLNFIHKSKKEIRFDPINQDFDEYIKIGIINCIVYSYMSGYIEISLRDSSKSHINYICNFLKENLAIKKFYPIEITNDDIKKFDRKADKITHERRIGEITTTALTRADLTGDTRKDKVREEIEDREFMKEHGIIGINENLKGVIGITRGKIGEIQFKGVLTLDERRALFKKLIEILEW